MVVSADYLVNFSRKSAVSIKKVVVSADYLANFARKTAVSIKKVVVSADYLGIGFIVYSL